MAVGGNSFSRPLQNICPQNQPSLSSTSHPAYEIIHRSESGSGYSNGVCSLELRRDRPRRKRTWNRRAEPNEPARFRDFLVSAKRKRPESTSRPILIKARGATAARKRRANSRAFFLQKRDFSRKIKFDKRPFVNEGDPGNVAGGRCFVSNDALDGRFARAGNGVRGIRSPGAVRIL